VRHAEQLIARFCSVPCLCGSIRLANPPCFVKEPRLHQRVIDETMDPPFAPVEIERRDHFDVDPVKGALSALAPGTWRGRVGGWLGCSR
jgi:hypothetical protein